MQEKPNSKKKPGTGSGIQNPISGSVLRSQTLNLTDKFKILSFCSAYIKLDLHWPEVVDTDPHPKQYRSVAIISITRQKVIQR